MMYESKSTLKHNKRVATRPSNSTNRSDNKIVALLLIAILAICIAFPGTVLAEDFDKTHTISETVLIETSEYIITALDITYGSGSAELNLQFENRSNQTLEFRTCTWGYSCNCVNGYMIDQGHVSCKVKPGKKAKESARFNYKELAAFGINEIADIGLGFTIDREEGDDENLSPVFVYTDIASDYDYEADTYKQTISIGAPIGGENYELRYYSDDETFSSCGLSLISVAYIKASSGQLGVFLEIENTSQDILYASISNISANNLVLYGGLWTSDSVVPGKRRVMMLSLSDMLDDGTLSLLNINDFTNIEYSISVKNSKYEELCAPVILTIDTNGDASGFTMPKSAIYDENGLCIYDLGLVRDSMSYSDDLHIILLVENKSDDLLYVDDAYDSFSVNGYMMDTICYSSTIDSGKLGIIDIELSSSDFEDVQITGIDDIQEAEITLEIRDNDYNEVAEPTLVFTYK